MAISDISKLLKAGDRLLATVRDGCCTRTDGRVSSRKFYPWLVYLSQTNDRCGFARQVEVSWPLTSNGYCIAGALSKYFETTADALGVKNKRESFLIEKNLTPFVNPLRTQYTHLPPKTKTEEYICELKTLHQGHYEKSATSSWHSGAYAAEKFKRLFKTKRFRRKVLKRCFGRHLPRTSVIVKYVILNHTAQPLNQVYLLLRIRTA